MEYDIDNIYKKWNFKRGPKEIPESKVNSSTNRDSKSSRDLVKAEKINLSEEEKEDLYDILMEASKSFEDSIIEENNPLTRLGELIEELGIDAMLSLFEDCSLLKQAIHNKEKWV